MPKELPELENILHSGALSYGKWGKEFESKLKEFIGCKHLMTTNAYSSAIQIALSVLGLVFGDEVISSPMSCLASNMPLITYGLKVKWADVDPSTGTLDPISVRQSISSNTKLIFHNHFCGYIGYVDEINKIGKEFDIPVIDDCVEAFGSKYKGNYSGNLGTDISIFSFQTIRLPNTIEGGAIVFNDEALYKKAIICRDLGILRGIFRDGNGEISPDCDISTKGYAGTMSDVNSYIGCLQMEKLSDLLTIQKNNAEYWTDFLKEYSERIAPLGCRGEIQPNYWVFGLLSENKECDMLRFRNDGYYASGVHLNNNCYSIFGEQVSLKGASEFYNKFLALPSGWWFSNK